MGYIPRGFVLLGTHIRSVSTLIHSLWLQLIGSLEAVRLQNLRSCNHLHKEDHQRGTTLPFYVHQEYCMNVTLLLTLSGALGKSYSLEADTKWGGGEKKRQPLNTQYVQGCVLAWFLSFCVGGQPIKGKDHSSMLSSYTGPE